MKGFAAIALAKLPDMVARNPSATFHLALSYDEEVGCLGVPLLIDDMLGAGIRPAACIVGEPTGMGVVIAQKGKIGCHVVVRGRASHTGVPHLGVNAIEAAARAIAHLSEVARRHREEGPHDPAFDAPPYTTIQHGLIEGGIAVNTVPDLCTYDFDIRHLPGVDPVAIVAELKRIRQDRNRTGHATDRSERRLHLCDGARLRGLRNPPRRAHRDSAVLALAPGGTTSKVGFGTEAGHFAMAGIPTVICGPGSIAMAHRADESLGLDQVAACERFLQDSQTPIKPHTVGGGLAVCDSGYTSP